MKKTNSIHVLSDKEVIEFDALKTIAELFYAAIKLRDEETADAASEGFRIWVEMPHSTRFGLGADKSEIKSVMDSLLKEMKHGAA